MKDYNLMECLSLYHDLGWVTLPIKKDAKMPYIKGWQQNTTKDNEYLKTQFHTTDNVGILTGKVSGIVVIDVDVKRVDGMATLATLEQEHGKLPRTVKATTPSGGIHLYFKYPENTTLVNKCNVGEGIDIQADGSQCVAYPSTTFGKAYQWEVDPFDNPIATLPAKWVALLQKNRNINIGGKRWTMPTYIGDGNRNIQLTQVAGHIAGSRKFTRQEGLDELLRANQKLCTPPLDDYEVAQIFDSIWSKQENATMEEYMGKLNTIMERKGEANIVEAAQESDISSWYVVDDKGKSQFYDEHFALWFIKEKKLVKYDGIVYTQDRQVVMEDTLGEWIAPILGPLFINGSLQTIVNKLAKLIPLYVPKVTPKENVFEVHFNNVAFNVKDGTLKEVPKEFSINLIPHNYNPDAKCPTWDAYLKELLSDEDARTLQQFIGYCLTPSTRAQVALFICGKGGEGKSRISSVLYTIFDNTLYSTKLTSLSEGRFTLAPLHHKLLAIDDDLDMGAFTQTDKIKQLITSEKTMELEEKGKPIKNVKLYSRILALGNGFPQSIYDHSDGWNRRIHPIITKPVPPTRVPDPNFSDKLEAEIEGIIAWAVRGLLDYINNGQRIFMSDSSKDIKRSLVDNNGDSFTAFVESGIVEFTQNEDDYVLQKDFAQVYNNYCFQNELVVNKGLGRKMVQYRQLSNHPSGLANTQVKRVNGEKNTSRVFLGVKLHRTPELDGFDE